MRAQITFALSMALVMPVGAQTPLPDQRRDDEYIRQLLLQAVDDAFRDQINHLFAVWMRSPEDQPRRALVGTHQAINAYKDIVKALEAKDWKVVAPPEPPHKLFPPTIPEAPGAAAPRERERHHRRH